MFYGNVAVEHRRTPFCSASHNERAAELFDIRTVKIMTETASAFYLFTLFNFVLNDVTDFVLHSEFSVM